jgi:hypothetical protein
MAALVLDSDWSCLDQAVENRDGGGSNWGLLQMPFGDNSPQDVPWPNVPIRFSKQYYTMMQVQRPVRLPRPVEQQSFAYLRDIIIVVLRRWSRVWYRGRCAGAIASIASRDSDSRRCVCVCVLQYSKFIKNGWTILDTDEDEWTLAAMYQNDDSSVQTAVVSTNTGLYDITVN